MSGAAGRIERMADHWWWRPGWAPGRRFYTWHLTFERQGEVHRLAADYRAALAAVPGLDPVPDRWLHLTMQGIGFTDEVAQGDADAIVSAAYGRLARIDPFTLELDRPAVTPEAIRWDPPGEGPSRVRGAIRAAVGEVWPVVPEPLGGFGAHVTIAYSNGIGSAAPVYDALERVGAEPATARVTSAELIVLGRDTHAYTWDTYASVPLRA